MRITTLLCATTALVLPSIAMAQETSSTIRGEVTANGAPVDAAEVVVTHVPSGTQSRTTTDASGSFNAPGLRVGGPFTVSVTAPGHEEQQITDIFLTAGQPFRIPVELNTAGEDIVVTGVRGARQTSQGPITALNREDIEGVASVNRDIRDIARRDPFVTMDLTNSRTIEVAGQNGRLNRFSVDGVQFSDDFGLNNGGLPTSRGPVPFDAIEQLAIKVAPYDISEGDFQGGAINVVLRSGANNFHGSAFFTYSDDSLTGTKTRDRVIDLKFDSKQYGALLSGPIVKDRLFFMLAYEKLNESDPFDDGVGPGFANQIGGITLDQVNQVNQIAQATYNYDTLGLIQNAVEEDEKIAAKVDLNITDDHRASVTYIRNVGTQQFQQNTFTTAPLALGLQSNGYQLSEEVNSGVFQLNSDWSDTFSTELRASYRDYNRDQDPFGGRNIAQFEVCLDPTSINSGTNSATSCGGSRIFFGPDISRQSNALNQENLSIDALAKLQAGNHSVKFLGSYTDISTYNLFLQNTLGNLYFDSLADFQARRANRLRLGGAVPSLDADDAAAAFTTQNWTFGIQDDWEVSPEFQLTAGIRYDLYDNPDRPRFNPNFFARNGFANTETFAGRSIVQPRIGFNWNPTKRLILRGGVGVFAGGTPDVFVSNSFSNTGQLSNQIDLNRANCAASATCAALDGVTGRDFPAVVTNFLATNVTSLANAPVSAIDPDLDVASQLRATLSANYEANLGPLGDGWLLGADILYGEVIDAYQWTDLRSVPIGTLPDGRTRYGPRGGVATTNQDLLMTNESRGRSYIGVARLAKSWDWGLSVDGSYTRSDIKDVNALTSATSGSLYSNNAFADPNFSAYGRSIYEITDQWKFSVDYKRAFFGDYKTRLSLFGEYRSGRPYSVTMLDRGTGRLAVLGTINNGGRGLLFVPELNDPRVSFDSAASEASFNTLVDRLGLDKYRGSIVPKNSQTSPDFFKVDLHLSQELPTFVGRSRFKLFADIENVLNLLDKDWGALRQVAFPYTASLADVQCLSVPTPTGTAPGAGVTNTAPTQTCAQYRYSRVTDPNLVLNSRQSLYQVRVGVRFEF
ncbi:MAG: TonB-dependent receptor [Sphingosinicella sp.]|nr:TonB-dependent receptor [Sphingosinicella sp.]